MKFEILRLGRRPFEEVWELQKSLQQSLMAGNENETLILCEHEAVITAGTSAHEQNILMPREELRKRGVRVFDIERGGDVTYHGPGQVVGYPIMDLHRHKTDVHWYMRSLEQVIIQTLQEFGIDGTRVDGKTGVWIEQQGSSLPFSALKIASMGVRLSRWTTMHGFALNVKDCSGGFSLINPCGFNSMEITWMERESGQNFETADVESAIGRHFESLFFSA